LKSFLIAVSALCLLGGCAARRPDHFYVLSTQPPGASRTRTVPAAQVALRVTLPSVVDRSQMVLNTSADAVMVLEHERWAAPLSDLAAHTLARDLERRRSDMLVTDPGSHRASGAVVKMNVDLVQVTLRRGERASIEAHWRILDPRSGEDEVGGEVFSAPLGPDGYAAVAQALSECLGLLADRLVGQMQ
jgi:uncharacterized lipoprotein YmbA